MTLPEAYQACRTIARREAKNFYYAFRVLPARKRDAMCAVYAFMRRADDIADDETCPVGERRVRMEQWLAAWRAGSSEDAVFTALADTGRRFAIPHGLLEELVQGICMDLAETGGARLDPGSGLQVYTTSDELYRYCYLVASVVGLVCIRIFGYTDPRAEMLAEKTGIAFQLTNILRDIREDAERGRLYLSLDLLSEFAVVPQDIQAIAKGRPMQPNERGLIHAVSARAWDRYLAAGELLPMIDADSRAALWVLVKIYTQLLARIDARNGDVISTRVSVPTPVKMTILARGAARSLAMRQGA